MRGYRSSNMKVDLGSDFESNAFQTDAALRKREWSQDVADLSYFFRWLRKSFKMASALSLRPKIGVTPGRSLFDFTAGGFFTRGTKPLSLPHSPQPWPRHPPAFLAAIRDLLLDITSPQPFLREYTTYKHRHDRHITAEPVTALGSLTAQLHGHLVGSTYSTFHAIIE